MAYFIGNRRDQIITASGHSALFRKGEKTQVPDNPDLVKLCTERGHQPVEEKVTQDEPQDKVVIPKQVGRAAAKTAA